MKPYLSFVVTSRNDDHGSDINRRMRIFMAGLIQQCNKFQLPVELIVVEWNPPADKPFLKEVMPQPEKGDFLNLRYIQVPYNIHQHFRFANTIPLYQMIAKNVGIRRANAEFVLCTNVDLLFSNELMDILSKKNLKRNEYYRANRCDIPNTVDEKQSIETQLEFAAKNILKRLGKQPEEENRIAKKTVIDRMKLEISNVDSDACGDFTLMCKDAWLDIQGYPELDLYSIHIDTMGIVAATALGYRQVIFPSEACTYHLEHKNGWETLTPLEKIYFINKKPGIGLDIVFESGKDLILTKSRYNFNAADWGFANLQLNEFVINSFD